MKSPMYTLRRLLALVLVLVMVGSLFAGCSKKDPDPTNPTEPSVEQTDAPTETPTEAPTEEPTEAPTEPTATVPPVVMGTVIADNLNVRSQPYSTADILKRLAINTRVEIEEQKIVDGVKWGRIAEGWINLNYVTEDGEEIGTGPVINNDSNVGTGTVDVNKTYNGTITATELHIRKDADADSASVGTYKKGDKVVIIGQRDGWGKTDKGWISMKYVDLTGTSSGSSSSSSSSSSSGSNNTTVSNGNKVALGTGTVKDATTLAVRTGPGANYTQVGFISLGDTVEYFQKSTNGWVRIKKGWVNSKYLDLEYAVASGTEGTVSATELHVREDADGEAKSLTTIKKDTKVTILEVKGTWGKIEYETGKFGWVSLDYIKFGTSSSTSTTYTTGDYTVTAEGLNYRKEANADSTALGTYKKDDKVTVTEVAGNWGKTDKGWINLKYTKLTSATSSYTTGTGEVTASSLNIRDKASTSGKDLGSLKKGEKVTILEVSGDWGKIEYETGKHGWISMKYVEMDPAPKYAVTVGTITGGTVKVSSTSYAKGSIVSLTVTPESGKELDTLTYTPEGGSAVAITGNKFTMPGAKVTINATFKAETVKYSVALNSNPAAGGTVTASSTSCAAGTTIVLTVTPKTGYALDSITVLNTTTNQDITASVSGGKFTMPEGNVNVVAKFVETTETSYTVQSTSDRVSVSSSSALAGAPITLTVSPKTGEKLSELVVKNTSDNSTVYTATSGNSHTFTMPAANVSVAATFEAVTYSVTITQAAEGTVISDKNAYKAGEKVTLIITPVEGYEVDTLKANGTDVKATSSFIMPGSDATVTVTYKKASYKVNITAPSNGTVTAKVGTADAATAKMGDTVTLTVTPATGYVLDKLEVKKGTDPVLVGSDNTFTMPAAEVTVTATFKAATP